MYFKTNHNLKTDDNFDKVYHDIKENKDEGAYAHLFYYLQLKTSDADFYNNWILNNQKGLILKRILDSNPILISDIGCGDGYWHKYFTENNYKGRVIGYDNSKEALKVAKALNNKTIFLSLIHI